MESSSSTLDNWLDIHNFLSTTTKFAVISTVQPRSRTKARRRSVVVTKQNLLQELAKQKQMRMAPQSLFLELPRCHLLNTTLRQKTLGLARP
jgi:hypothetical protein